MNNPTIVQAQEPMTYPTAIVAAAACIAPAWPLDTAIAANPWWPLREQKFSDVAANLEAIGDVKCLMPKAFYRDHWGRTISKNDLVSAARLQAVAENIDELVAFLDSPDKRLPHWHNLSDLLDALPAQAKKIPWHDEIIQQISQFCGLYFQHSEHIREGDEDTDSLYKSWLNVARKDKGIEVLMGEPGLHQQFMALPECPKSFCKIAIETLGSPAHLDQYAHSLLFDVHGWASYMAYQAWQDNFIGKTNSLVEQLLAIRLAWDWVLWRQREQHDSDAFVPVRARFLSQFEQLPLYKQLHREQQQLLWVWQKALELSYQSELNAQLYSQLKSQPHSPLVSTSSHQSKKAPILQAVFCIDVRSEPMRRALEAQHPDIETIGFAGFFGLPIEYTLSDSHYRRAQLPGLLAPAIQATQNDREACTHAQSQRLRFSHNQNEVFNAAPASLGMVEMLGLFKVGELIKNSFWPANPKHAINDLCDDRPFELSCNGSALKLAEKTELAANILTNLGLFKRFATTVLLLGHGSCTANNPQGASLDCGACGGQSGEVNVKVLAQLLNDSDIRHALRHRGFQIPPQTRFIAGLHNTTSDDINCFGAQTIEPWQQWLAAATERAQAQRAASLGLNPDLDLPRQYRQRSRDWSQVRPEWGLVNNAAFIIAPRALTRDLNLQGRSFLNDYDCNTDPNSSILELIMTAPMIVTNWINLQYFASVTDNRIYGSGNKLLHNVVGDHIGVFEGNGGDLRIGLSMQSLHDGQQWRHTPIRLNVYIAATRAAIEDIVSKHEAVAQLINNEWLYLFQLDSETKSISRYYASKWHCVEQNALNEEVTS